MSHDDYEKGRSGIGSGTGMDYLKGVNERERERAAAKPPAPPEPASYPPPDQWHSSNASDTGQLPGPGRNYAPPAPETLKSMAKSGAGLMLILFVGYTLLYDGTWTWAKMIAGAAVAGALGAIAGAALYVAIRLLMILLRVAGVLLLIGVALHLLGVLDLVAVLGRIWRGLGL